MKVTVKYTRRNTKERRKVEISEENEEKYSGNEVEDRKVKNKKNKNGGIKNKPGIKIKK